MKPIKLNVPLSRIPRHLYRDELLIPFDKYLDELFNNAFPEIPKIIGNAAYTNTSYPKVDVVEHKDKIVIMSELAGFSKKDIDISIQDGVLTIAGKVEKTNENIETNYIMKELRRSGFSRSFTLSESLDVDSIDAQFENGLLTVTLKKLIEVPQITAKKVEIK